MDVLVTGGAGFIGGHLAERLLREGTNVAVLNSVHLSYDIGTSEHTLERNERVAAEVGPAYAFVEGDVRDVDLVADADPVFHRAARAGVRASVAEPRVYDAVNVDGTLNVLDAARDADVDRVVVASSSSVSGGREAYLPFSESDPTRPVSPYAASKLAAERYAGAYHEVYDLPTVALRYVTVYGPRMRPNMAISNFVSRCANGESPVVYGDGTQTRDFTYVDDVLEANLAMLSTDAADGEVLTVGLTDSIAIRTLAEEVRDQLSPGVELAFDERHDADADHTLADVSKARELLGYEPTHTIREEVATFVAWYHENREWYEPLVRSS